MFDRRKTSRSSQSSSSEATSKRKVNRSRELWTDLFMDALSSLMNGDEEKVREYNQEEAEAIVNSAGHVADAALKKIEDRWVGL